MAINPEVTAPGRADSRAPVSVRGVALRIPLLPSRTSSGHWNPTEAGIMHSGQMGRSQRVQRMRVDRSGCR